MILKFIIYLFLLLGVSLIGVVKFKQLTAPFKVILFLVVVTFISESIALTLALKIHMSFPVYHFYVLISLLLYSFIFHILLRDFWSKKVILILTILFILLSILNSIFVQPLKSFPSYSILLSSFIIVIYTLMFLRQILDARIEEPLYNKSQLILSMAMLLFFSVQIFNWGIYNYFLKHQIASGTIANFGYYMSLLYYATVGWALKIDKQKI